MRVIKGNLLHIKNGTIGHQTNCIGVARAGVAGDISKYYPDWEIDYVAACRKHKVDELLGKVHFYQATDTLTIASLFGQRVPGKGVMTDDRALGNALLVLNKVTPLDTSIYLPYGIGCGLAGGDWNVIQSLIEECCPRAILVKLR